MNDHEHADIVREFLSYIISAQLWPGTAPIPDELLVGDTLTLNIKNLRALYPAVWDRAAGMRISEHRKKWPKYWGVTE